MPDAMGSGTTAPHQLLSYSTEHHQSPSYRVLEQKGPSEVSAEAGSVEHQSLGKIGAV